MIGIPPLAGFLRKWYLGAGGLEVGQPAVIALLAGSSLLNAAYFLPILYRAWFLDPPENSPVRRDLGWMLILPPALTAALVVAAGLFANAPFSPLGWTRFIVSLEYL